MDEKSLISGLRRGNAPALSALHQQHGIRLLRSAYLLCGDQTEAEDLVQETFLQAIRSAHRFRGGSSLYTWLHAILLNLVRHYHRKRWRLVCDNELVHREAAAAESGPGPDREVAASALGAALQELSLAQREVIVLRYFEDLKIHQIAAHLGLPTGTVKSRLHYAIAELQRRLPAEMNLFGPAGTNDANDLPTV